MEKLFSYGTLQLASVQEANFGRLLNGKKETLIGFIVGKIKIKDKEVIRQSGKEYHPILRYTGNPKDEINGTLYEVTKDELLKADSYEVEEYSRIKVKLKSGEIGWIYVATEEVDILNKLNLTI